MRTTRERTNSATPAKTSDPTAEAEVVFRTNAAILQRTKPPSNGTVREYRSCDMSGTFENNFREEIRDGSDSQGLRAGECER